jgi:hypothetical protein
MGKKLSLVFIICVSLAGYAWADRQADYTAAVLADNPLGYWQFEDAASYDGAPCADSAAGGLSPGVYRNRLQGTPNDVPDITLVTGFLGCGHAAKLHGTISGGKGNFVEIFDNVDSGARLMTPSCTIEFWMRALPTENETYARFISHAEGTTNNYWIGMATAGSSPGQPFVGVPGATWYAGPPILTNGQWHHVVVTYTYNDPNTTTELWIDCISRGTHEDAGAFTGPTNDWADLIIGAENNQYWVFNGFVGLLDEVAYYDYALSENQISIHFPLIYPPYPGDINWDRRVDFKDFAELCLHWQTIGGFDTLADIADSWLIEYY